MPESTVPGQPARATQGELDENARSLGARIRVLRKQRGLTLTQAAAQAELSHSFLSQVERGLERLSMASLFRIARALQTTQQDLLAADGPGEPRGGRFHVFSGSAGSPVDSGGAPLQVLSHGGATPPFLPMIFGGSYVDDEWWVHDEEEFVYVIDGSVTICLDDAEFLLTAGDSTYYEGGVRHQWRTVPGESCRLLVVKEMRPGQAASDHDPSAAPST